MLRLLALSAALICALAFAACGSDDDGGSGGGDAEKEIIDVLTAGLTSRDVAVVCEGSLSTSLINRTYGDAKKCRTVEKEDLAENDRAKSVDVSAVQVDGDKATATIKVSGGDQDGATGPLTLVQEEPGWRVEDFSTALLRSQFEAGMRNDREIPAGVKDCIGKEVLGLPEGEFRDIAYGSIGNKPETEKKLVGIFTTCAADLGGGEGNADADAKPSVLRSQFEQGIAQSLEKDGVSAEAIACVKRELRSRITDKQILDAVSGGRENLPEAVTAATAAAMGECDAT